LEDVARPFGGTLNFGLGEIRPTRERVVHDRYQMVGKRQRELLAHNASALACGALGLASVLRSIKKSSIAQITCWPLINPLRRRRSEVARLLASAKKSSHASQLREGIRPL